MKFISKTVQDQRKKIIGVEMLWESFNPRTGVPCSIRAVLPWHECSFGNMLYFARGLKTRLKTEMIKEIRK